jgi:hypothetical protein
MLNILIFLNYYVAGSDRQKSYKPFNPIREEAEGSSSDHEPRYDYIHQLRSMLEAKLAMK